MDGKGCVCIVFFLSIPCLFVLYIVVLFGFLVLILFDKQRVGKIMDQSSEMQ